MTIETAPPGGGDQHRHQPTPTVTGLVCRGCGRPEARASTTSVRPASARSRSRTTSTPSRGGHRRRSSPPGPRASGATASCSPSSRRSAGSPSAATPLVARRRLGEALGVDGLLIKDDTRNPTLSFKDRAVAIATAKALALGLDALACASTGNLAGATAAAAAAAGLPAYVFVPADLEPAKIEHALAYGATVVPIDGTYDDVNRLCLEVADELGWGTVNVNLRPYYAEGSKTLAYEIAEALGWRLPDVVVAPIASGAMLTRVARAFEELVELGWVAPHAVRFVGGQAAGLRAGRDGVRRAAPTRSRPVRTPDTIVRSLAIGNPADGALRARARPADGRLDRGDRRRHDRGRHPAPRRGSRACTPRRRAA